MTTATGPAATISPRRIVVKDHEGYPILEMPMFGAVAAFANDWSIEVEDERPEHQPHRVTG